MTRSISLPLVVRWPPAPAKKPRLVAGTVPLIQLSNGKVSPIEKNLPLLTLMVTVPVDTRLLGASVAAAWLVTLLNSKVVPALVPNVSVFGVICEPFSNTPRAALSATVISAVPDLVPWNRSSPRLTVVSPE